MLLILSHINNYKILLYNILYTKCLYIIHIILFIYISKTLFYIVMNNSNL